MEDKVQLRDVAEAEADLEIFFEQEHDPEAIERSKFHPDRRGCHGFRAGDHG